MIIHSENRLIKSSHTIQEKIQSSFVSPFEREECHLPPCDIAKQDNIAGNGEV